MDTLKHPTYLGFKPSKTRKIKKRFASYRGLIASTREKNENLGTFPYESSLERDALYLIDHDLNCAEYLPQSEFILNDNNNKSHAYHVDCWAVFYVQNSWINYIFEMKYEKEFIKLQKEDKNWNQRINALEKYCEVQNKQKNIQGQQIFWKFKVITEKYIYNTRLLNLLKFLDSTIQNPNKIIQSQIWKAINNIYTKSSEYTYIDMIKAVQIDLENNSQNISLNDIETVVNYCIYHQKLFFDWNVPFSNVSTLLVLNLNYQFLLEPFFEIRPMEREYEAFESKVLPARFDIALIDKKLIDDAKRKYDIIKPLTEFYKNKSLKKLFVQDRAKEFGISWRTVYIWLKKYDESGNDWKSLISNYKTKGNRTPRLNESLENIITKHITYQCSCCKMFMRKKKIWFNIKNNCDELGLKIPSLNTIRKRINLLPAKERKGTQGGIIEYEIAQSVKGRLPRGKFPLDLVQVDSTILDIFIIDEIDEKQKRPVLTIFIDTCTRMIFSYWLTLHDHTAVDVNRGLMRGFLPKDDLLKNFNLSYSYPIYGIPHRLQFDNGKIFDTEQVMNFCFRYGVADYQFRMVKRPDKGGFVERMFRTINETWLSELSGYSPPLKSRLLNYQPNKENNLVLFSYFQEWFLNKLIIYHNTNHSGLKEDTGIEITPQNYYTSLMQGRNPQIVKNAQTLQFEVLHFKETTLRPEGIVFFHNKYNNDGNKGYLRKIRARNRGKTKSILWRFDPEDIREIWVFDDESNPSFYFNVKLSSGPLVNFIQKYTTIPISLRDYKSIIKEFKNEKDQLTNQSEKICLKLEEQNKFLIAQNNRQQKKNSKHLVNKKDCNIEKITDSINSNQPINFQNYQPKILWKTEPESSFNYKYKPNSNNSN